MHVPLLVRWPAGLPGGVRVDEPASLLDIYPTLAELLGLTAPSGLQGESLVPLLRGATPYASRLVYSELHPPRPALKAVQDGEWKLIRDFGKKPSMKLFDLTHDPGELHDVAAQHRDIVGRLQGGLDAWRAALPAPPPDRASVPLEDESVKEHMRALGYLQ